MQTQIDPGLFKSYDVRGIYPSELNDDIAYGIGRCFVPLLGAKRVVVGRDMRPSGEKLYEAFARGVTDAGADVTYIGMVSTDALYFAVGKYGFDGGVMITASHNPAQYNGMKFTREKAEAISLDTGLAEIRDRLISGELPPKAATPGKIDEREILDEFAQHCLSFIDPKKIKPFKIAIDAGNGMAGETVPHVFKNLTCEVVPLYFELDGTFPNHPASPIEPENMADLQAAVETARLRSGRGVRRRRRPHVHRRRKRRSHRRQHRDDARRAQHAQKTSRREDSLQSHLQPQRSGAGRESRRHSGTLAR